MSWKGIRVMVKLTIQNRQAKARVREDLGNPCIRSFCNLCSIEKSSPKSTQGQGCAYMICWNAYKNQKSRNQVLWLIFENSLGCLCVFT